MYLLLIATCVVFQCEHIQVVSEHATLEACESVMEKKWADVKEGEALLCIPSQGVNPEITA